MEARKRRAVGLIAISLIAIGVASMAYVLPGLHLGEAAKPQTIAARPALPTPSPQPFPISYDFATPSVGWAITARPIETAIFKTVDGGKHWRLASRLEDGTYGATIQFVDTTHGFVVTSAPDRLYRTTDGGAHWVRATMPGDKAYRITFTDPYRGSGMVPPPSPNVQHTVYTTEDGGSTWRRLPDVPRYGSDPVFRGSEAWLSANGSPSDGFHVFASYDRGLSWSWVDVPRPAYGKPLPAAPQFFSAQVNLLPGAGVAVRSVIGVQCRDPSQCVSNEAFFVSLDRGGAWKEVPLPPGGSTSFRDIAYQDASHWWALGDGLLFKSSDAGQTWDPIGTTMPRQSGMVMHIFDAQHAWAQGSIGLYTFAGAFPLSSVVVTSDGGANWTRVLPPQVS
jgi:photosystem II stability/assembly factor-like uncharacterized protein